MLKRLGSKLCSAAAEYDEPLSRFLRASVQSMSLQQILEQLRDLEFRTRYGNPFTKGALYRKLAQFDLSVPKLEPRASRHEL